MDRKRLLKNPLLWIVVAVLLYFAVSSIFDEDRGYTHVDTGQAVAQIGSGNVAEAKVKDKEQTLKLTLDNSIDADDEQVKKVITKYPQGASENIYNQLQKAANNNNVEFDTEVSGSSWFTQLLIYLIPLVLLLLLLMWMMNNAQGGGGGKIMQFGKSKAKQFTKDMPTTSFGDVAGADEAVEELHEIKDFLQQPARYQALGAKIPKGVLLYGPPGTGKTLLARAVAGEAGVPFYTISGSDFVEMFVGVGASRVRDMFEQAKNNAPCIVFVDELDAVGRQRGAGVGGGHDEREQTLNQLLVEMDGFDARGGIILIAATNRPDILDPALLRPGRFDRQIPVSAPDLRGRKAILNVHAQGKPLAQDADMDGLAKRTVGMSGADLANVINEAALLTARQGQQLITETSLEESVDRVVGGPARKSRVISEREKKITAYHEGGHALAAWAMPDIEPVYKLTILPRGRTGGHALLVPEDDKDLMTRSEMLGRLVFAMGGRTAEELVFHEPTTGAQADIEQATKIAKAMVKEYGMSARLGAVKYGEEQGDPFLGRSAGKEADYSLEVAHEIDEEVRKLIETAHTEAWHVLNNYREVLDDLVREVLEKETLQRKDLERIFASVEKRPRITVFNEFGDRRPSEKPPIKTPGEQAMERGEPWPPPREDSAPPQQQTPPAAEGGQQPAPVGSNQSGSAPGEPGAGSEPSGNPYAPPAGYANGSPNGSPYGGASPAGGGPNHGPPNYGAPPGWTPATGPRGPASPRPTGSGGPYGYDPSSSVQPGQQPEQPPGQQPGSPPDQGPTEQPPHSRGATGDDEDGNHQR